MKNKHNITEGQIKNAVSSVLNEFLNRDEIERYKSFGIEDPTEKYIVNVDELKQKAGEFVQKTTEYLQYFKSFYQYIDGVEEDTEKGIEAKSGVRSTIQNRNMFGARNLSDEYLEQDLTELSKVLYSTQSALEETLECAEAL